MEKLPLGEDLGKTFDIVEARYRFTAKSHIVPRIDELEEVMKTNPIDKYKRLVEERKTKELESVPQEQIN